MGIALAKECLRRGMTVELVCGPISVDIPTHPNLHLTRVESAQEMCDACVRLYPQTRAAILCAAVADFTPAVTEDEKIKRKGDELVLHLRPTADIAATLGRMKRNDQLLVGFALETTNEQTNAEGKLQRKNFDFIVLNSLRDAGAGFRTDTNKITIIRRDLTRQEFPLKSKTEVASDIIDELNMLLQR
jgi:phosphopantothenoylcysteine decarboxylase/phosphopantothenate--cysteine ligase